MAIPATFLDELRGRTDLAGLLARSVKLTRAGRDMRGCCPFHEERSPSFYVYADHYHCFGCGKHGDAVSWLTEKQGLAFPDAVRELAQAAGLEMPEESREARAKAERQVGLREPLEAAAKWFAERLWGSDGADARAYLTRRGVKPETARAFGLGFAPDGRTGLARALGGAGEAKLIEAGLLIQGEQGPAFDRFRGRLMFPIGDARGRTVGFGGRALGDVQPKYLNSPDTPLFDKGRLLYNLDKAGAAARKAGRLIFVEGYMDTIALAEAGVEEVVAPMGTALTEAQLALAWRLVPEPVLCFDGDRAGLAAAGKAAKRSLPGLAPGRSLRFITLPPGQDPDDVVRAGGRAAFEALAANPEPLHALLWRTTLAAADTSSPEGRAGLKAELNKLAADIADKDVREQYEALFREQFWEAFGWRKSGAAPPLPVQAPSRRVAKPIASEAHLAMVGLLAWPEIASDHAEAVAAMPVADRRLLKLRGAIIDAVMWEPDLTAEGLAAYLARAGLADEAAWAVASCPLHLSFTRARPLPQREGEAEDAYEDRVSEASRRARAQLPAMVDALAWLEQNFVARVTAYREHRELLATDSGDERLQAQRSALFDRIRLLQDARRAHYEALYAFAQEMGADPDLGVKPINSEPGENDGEERGGSDSGTGGDREQGRRAAHRG